MEFAQFGVAIFSMGVLAYVLRLAFKKDNQLMDYMRSQEENFVEVVKNHLSHNTEALNELKTIMREILILLKRNNRR